MGSDLMCVLGVTLLSTPEGVKVHTEVTEMTLKLTPQSHPPMCAYEWQSDKSQLLSVSLRKCVLFAPLPIST